MGVTSSYRGFERNDDSSDDSMNQPEPVGELYVEETAADLPGDPEASAFAVTGEGVFGFSQSDGAWQPITYGSAATPIPSVTARSATVGAEPTGRPLISNGNRTVYVDPGGGDDSAAGTEDDPLATIQEAIQRAPIYLRDQYVVDLATAADIPVTYDEDVLVPTIIGTGQAGQEVDAPSPGPFANLVVRGDRDDAGAVKIGSLMFANLIGTSVGNLYGVTLLRDSPYDDEGFGLSAYGSGEVKLLNVTFGDDVTNGVLVYGARMKARGVHFGDGALDIGLKAKRHASVVIHEPRGNLASDGFRATSNSMISIIQGRSISGSPIFNTLRGGLIYDGPSDSWIGLSGNSSANDLTAEADASSEQFQAGSGQPGDASPGALWYEDGSGDRDEGFYGRTEGGVQRIV